MNVIMIAHIEPDIGRKLGNISTTLAVDTGKVNADLREFISFKVNENSKPNEWTPKLKNSVQEALINKAGGLSYGLLVLKSLKTQIRTKLEIS